MPVALTALAAALISASPFIGTIIYILHQHDLERKRWEAERGVLLNRIKPETAQMVPGEPEPLEAPQPPTSDEEWWEQRDRVAAG